MNQPAIQAAVGDALTVLVVDDSRLQRRLLTGALLREGYRVLEAGSGEAALALCRAEPVDILISDWMMPGISGPDLIHAWRAETVGRYGYALLLTSKSGKADVAEGLDKGADDFLTKPVNGGELRARLRAGERVIRMERQLSEKNALLATTLAEAEALHAVIERDLIEARKLQQSLVRRRNRRIGASEVTLLLHPSGHVGGDLVGVIESDGPEIALYAIDVSGHGIASALMTARLAGYLSGKGADQNIALVPGPGGTRLRAPDEVAARLNDLMLTEIDSDLYCTFIMARFDFASARLCLVQAGQPHPILHRRSGVLERPGAGGQPLGLFDTPLLDRVDTTLQDGDRLLLISDGLSEVADRTGTQLSDARLAAAVRRNRALDGDSFLHALLWDLERWSGAAGFEDDVSAVLFDYRADAT
ncbi:PP2C family protein-serine/threonine phosphatase [Anianabacter salinae]|uniref:PP2C family protein-serine/threonine phosphatase n=1 Tax=Anianabacter salinae TaxID=2851023 RepID=UPI00225DF1C6|nr:SpoIIE family protein phosphatase [Anianabacter salinae]MBV0913537.1 SpoIIE family protein phosphatase [Anianabacter salinae]